MFSYISPEQRVRKDHPLRPIRARSSLKSFQPKDKEKKHTCPPDDPGNPTVNFHWEKRSNQTHESKKRSGGTAGAQRQGQGGQVELLRESADGESSGIDRRTPDEEAAVPSTAAPRDKRAMPSARRRGSASKNASAG